MSSEKRTLSFKADADMADNVERYQTSRGYEDRTDALKELVQVGLREQRNPIIWRLKDNIVDWASMLAIAAIIVALMGSTTDIIAVYDAAAVSITLLITSCGLLAAFEFTRIVMGMNAVGGWARSILGKVKS